MRGLAILTLIGSLFAASVGDPDPSFGERNDGDSYIVDGLGSSSGSSSANPASSSGGNNSLPPREFFRGPICASLNTRMDQSPLCPNDDPIIEYCIDGSEAVPPLWMREFINNAWTQWAVIESYTCPNDAPLISAIEHEWTQLKPQPSAITLQPNTGWVIATVPTIAMAGDAPRLPSAVLLGANVDIRATASGYRWTWGDGSHTTTTDPGRPYPNATVTHTYPHASDAATVQLTTTWSGEFRINGGPWQPFTSTITSDSDPVPLTVYDPRSRLVDCTLEGVCHLASNG